MTYIDDHQPYNDHDGDRKEHAGSIQQAAAEKDAEKDSNGVEMQRAADEHRIDQIVIQLCDENIETHRLNRNPWGNSRCKCRTEGGGTGRSDNGDEFADAGKHGKNRSIGQIAEFEIAENDEAHDKAYNQLTEDVYVQ